MDTPSSRSGLTLLELILSLVLMATMLAAAWSLLGIFRNRLETSQRQVEQWQLVRSLQQVLSSDLLGCSLPLPPEGASTSSGGRARDSVVTTTAIGDDASQTLSSTLVAERRPSSTEAAAEELRRPVAEGLDGAPPSAGAEDADAVVRGAWLQPDSFLLGTSRAIMFDMLPPAQVEGPQPPVAEPPADQATIPDTLRRVVYVFQDPMTAAALDRPPGLVRCELTQRQLTILRQLGGGDADLLTALRPAIEQTREASSEKTNEQVFAQQPTSDLPAEPLVERPMAEIQDPLALSPDMDLGLDQHLDYLPEVATFVLRYYDGATWQMRWDSRQQRRLPVAIELRFQLTSELKPVADERLAGMNQPADLPPDDSFRSAQTRPPEDHRWLIILHPSQPNPPESNSPTAPPHSPVTSVPSR